MNHQLINTGAGWRCLRCKIAWDLGDDAPETCEASDDYGFVTDQAPERRPAQDVFLSGGEPFPEGRPQASFVYVTSPEKATALARRAVAFRVNEESFPKADTMTVQIGGGHYKTLAIQPTEFCQRNGLDFCIGSILKYLTRWRSKNGIEDLRKARHFVEIREAFPYHIRQPGRIEITMLEYVSRNNIRPDDAESLYRLEAYYNADLLRDARAPKHPARAAARVIAEIDALISRAA